MLQAGPVGNYSKLLYPILCEQLTDSRIRALALHRLFASDLTLEFVSIVNVHLPKDRVSMSHQGYGFCEFLTEEDAEYACKIMNQIKLWGKPIRVNKVRKFLTLRYVALNPLPFLDLLIGACFPFEPLASHHNLMGRLISNLVALWTLAGLL